MKNQKISQQKNNSFISLVEASRLSGISRDYLNLLIRLGKLHAVKQDRVWLTTRAWLLEYQGHKEIQKVDREKYLSLFDASKIVDASPGYLNVAIKRGKLHALKLGRNWFTTKEWIGEYRQSVGRPETPTQSPLTPPYQGGETGEVGEEQEGVKIDLTETKITIPQITIPKILPPLNLPLIKGEKQRGLAPLIKGKKLAFVFTTLAILISTIILFSFSNTPVKLATNLLDYLNYLTKQEIPSEPLLPVFSLPRINTLEEAFGLDVPSLPSVAPAVAGAKEGETSAVSSSQYTIFNDRLSLIESSLNDKIDLTNAELFLQKLTLVQTLDSLKSLATLIPSHPASTFIVQGTPATLTSYSVQPQIHTGFDHISGKTLTLSNEAVIKGNLTVQSGATLQNGLGVTGDGSVSGVFTTGGNLGIATTSPAHALVVQGNSYLYGGLGVGISTTTLGAIQTSGDIFAGRNLYVTGITNLISGNLALTNASSTYLTVSDTSWLNALQVTGTATTTFNNPITSASGDFIIAGNSANDVLLNPYGGNVGIGTTTPHQQLTVWGNGMFYGTLSASSTAYLPTLITTNGTITNASTTYATLPTFWGTNGTITNASSTYLTLSGNSWLANSTITNGTITNASTTYLTVSDTAWLNNLVATNATTTTFRADGLATFGGNVGIGTTTPDQKLTVWGNGMFYGTLSASSTAYFVNASSTYGTITNLWATNGTITNASSTYGTISTLWSNLATIPEFNFTNATGTRLSITNATTTSLAVTGSATSTFAGPISSASGDFIVAGNSANDVLLNPYGGNILVGTTTSAAAGYGMNIATSTFIYGNLLISGNSTTIGASSADTLTVNSSVNSSLIPNVNNSYGLGSASYYWGTSYIATLNVNNLAAASSTLGGTQNESWIINSDNATNDNEMSYLNFFRGSPGVNALLTWNAATSSKRFEFNHPLYINNESASTTNPTLTIQTIANQTANGLQVIDNNSNNIFSVNPSGSKTTMINASSTYLTISDTAWINKLNVTNTNSTSTITGGLTIGNNAALTVQSNAAAATLALTDVGVGIGTTGPLEKLEVTGGIRIGQTPVTLSTTTVAMTSTTTTATVASTSGYPSTGTLLIDSEAMTYTGVTATTFTGLTRGALGTTAATHSSGVNINNYLFTALTTATTPKMVITGEGNVGIGTTTPDQKLTVWGNGMFYGTLSASSTAYLPTLITTNGTITNASSTYGTISTLWSNLATIPEFNFTNATGTRLSITNASTTYATLPTFWGTNGTITNASSTYLTISGNSWLANSTITNGTITNASSTYLTATNLWGTTGNITELTMTNATSTRFMATNGTITNLTQTNASSTYLTVSDTSWINALQVTGTATTTFNNPITSASGDFIIAGNSANDVLLNPYGGNVGIGTTTPHQQLTVWGNGMFYGTLSASSTAYLPTLVTTNGTITELTMTNATSTRFMSTNGTITNASTTYATLPTFWGTTGTITNGTITNASSTYLTISDTAWINNLVATNATTTTFRADGLATFGGNVGIGTTSPQTKLEVTNTSSGATADQLYLTNLASATSTASRLTFRTSDISGATGTSTAAITGILTQNWTTGKGDLAFSTLRSGTLTEAMRINDLGYVGIGTSNPDTSLHIASSTAAAFRIESTLSSLTTNDIVGAIEFETQDNSYTLPAITGRIDLMATETNGTGQDMRFFTFKSGVGLTEQMRILDSGNVGIGTTTPGSLLSVHSTGNVYFGGGLTVSGQTNLTNASTSILTAPTFFSTSGTITNASTTYLTVSGNSWLANSTITNGTITNASSTYATLPTFWGTTGNITELTMTNATSTRFMATSGTITNASTTYATLPTFWGTNGTITNASSTYLTLSGNSWLANSTITNGTITNASTTYATIPTFWSSSATITGGTITGITDLTVADGGTGASTLTDHGVLVGSGTDAITPLTVGTNGQLLVGSSAADPVFATLNCANGLTCTTGAGTLQIDFDGGDAPAGELGGTWASPTIDDLFIKLVGDTTGALTEDLNIDANTLVVDYDANNVGIGTTSPWGKLSIQATDNASIPQFIVASSTATSFIVDKSGNVGIGDTDPTEAKLTVTGDINFTGKLLEDGVEIFSGIIAPFNGTCPTGWSEYTSARGRYIVGVPDGGTLAATVGTALTDQENRVVGPHTHNITDPGHTHKVVTYSGTTYWFHVPGGGYDAYGSGDDVTSSVTGIAVLSTGTNISTTAGTNAPYIQLTYCQKTAGADLAEWIGTNETLKAGDIVSIDPLNTEKVIASHVPYDTASIGVVSTAAGWLMGTEIAGDVPLALSGRVPVRVSLKNGEISRGDPITTSDIPGVGMKAIEAGSVIGKAMEPLNSQSSLASCETNREEKCGTIIVFLNISYFGGSSISALTAAAPATPTSDVALTTSQVVNIWNLDQNTSLASNKEGGMAENYESNETLEAGEIVQIKPTPTQSPPYQGGEEEGVVEKAVASSTTIIGVVSTNPVFVFGNQASSTVPVALAGRVPVKASLENGPISIGDRISVSSIPGVGKSAKGGSASGGKAYIEATVGIALEPFDGWTANPDGSQTYSQTGKVLVFINLGQPQLAAKQGTIDLQHVTSDMDMGGFSLLNVKSIVGMNGLWSIDEGGNIKAQSVETQKLTVGGGATSGVTIYNRTTGQPKCIYIDGESDAIMVSTGACGTTQNEGTEAAVSPPYQGGGEEGVGTSDVGGLASSTPTLAPGGVGAPTESVGAEPILTSTSTIEIIPATATTPINATTTP